MLLSPEEIISKSWRDYVKNWHDWAIYSLILFIPGFVLVLSGSFGGYLNTSFPATSLPTNIIILLLVIASAVMWFWSYLALTHAIGKYLKVKETDHWKEHYTASLGFFWPAIFVSIIKGALVIVGTLFFLVPGIIFSVWYAFIIFGVVHFGERGWAAMKSSKELVRGRWWGVTWRLVLPMVVFGVGVALANALSLLLLSFLPLTSESNALLGNVVSSLFTAVFTPLTTIAVMNLYFNLKENPVEEILPMPVS
ncbi:MAG: hypothetical protein AAB467_01960 [Patescibacteria group bacterium]